MLEKKIRVAINGLGRIGRLCVKKLVCNENIELVALNSTIEAVRLAYFLNYDSTYFLEKSRNFSFSGEDLVFEEKKVKVFLEKSPEDLPWGELDIDIVIECSGIFLNREGLEGHVKAGAKKVLLSAPANNLEISTILLGVNDDFIRKNEIFFSGSSCTTNCLAPMIKVLENNFGIEGGFFTTIHAYTSDQRLLDNSHVDLRRGRSAARSIVPSTTGAAKNIEFIFPQLKGKIKGIAVRVPVECGSVVDLSVQLKVEARRNEINESFKKASIDMPGILEYCTDSIVSVDVIGNENSCVFDSLLTDVQGKTAKIFAWYDNEKAYAKRLCEIVERIFL